MDLFSANITFAGYGNQGLEVGVNSGTINVAAPSRPKTPPKPSCFVPFRRNPDFVGRTILLDQIREQCSAPASRVALVGIGGVGKSASAIEYCYRTAEQLPQSWVFWVHASNTARLEQSFRAIAEQIKISDPQKPQADVFKLVHDWLRDKKNGPWLLVLDNADDTAVLSPQLSSSHDDIGEVGSNIAFQERLSKYLPPSSHGSVLVTSRTRRAAMQIVESSDIILIEAMHKAAACTLLHKKLETKSISQDGSDELAEELEYIPLALVQAAAYIRERAPRCTVRQYLEEFKQSESRKKSLLNKTASHILHDDAVSNSVLLTWQISFDHIRMIRSSAADLLSLMSFFDRQGIPEHVLRSSNTTTDDSFEDDIITLRNYSFVTITSSANTFEMHSLLQLAIRQWLENRDEADKWRKKFIYKLCLELHIAVEDNDWERPQALYPHAKAALAQRPKDKESLRHWVALLYNAAQQALRRGLIDESEHMLTIAKEVSQEVWGKESSQTMKITTVEGLVMLSKWKFGEAELILKRNLALQKKVLHPEHLDIITSTNQLAGVLLLQGKHKEAESRSREALALQKKALGCELPDIIARMKDLTMALHQQGKHEEAELQVKETLALQEVLEFKEMSMLNTMNTLSNISHHRKNHQEAELLSRQMLVRAEEVLGSDNPLTLSIAMRLADFIAHQFRFRESLAIYKRACTGHYKVFGKHHPCSRLCHDAYARIIKLAAEHERRLQLLPATREEPSQHQS